MNERIKTARSGRRVIEEKGKMKPTREEVALMLERLSMEAHEGAVYYGMSDTATCSLEEDARALAARVREEGVGDEA